MQFCFMKKRGHFNSFKTEVPIMQSQLLNWFLYDRDIHHEIVNQTLLLWPQVPLNVICISIFGYFSVAFNFSYVVNYS